MKWFTVIWWETKMLPVILITKTFKMTFKQCPVFLFFLLNETLELKHVFRHFSPAFTLMLSIWSSIAKCSNKLPNLHFTLRFGLCCFLPCHHFLTALTYILRSTPFIGSTWMILVSPFSSFQAADGKCSSGCFWHYCSPRATEHDNLLLWNERSSIEQVSSTELSKKTIFHKSGSLLIC